VSADATRSIIRDCVAASAGAAGIQLINGGSLSLGALLMYRTRVSQSWGAALDVDLFQGSMIYNNWFCHCDSATLAPEIVRFDNGATGGFWFNTIAHDGFGAGGNPTYLLYVDALGLGGLQVESNVFYFGDTLGTGACVGVATAADESALTMRGNCYHTVGGAAKVRRVWVPQDFATVAAWSAASGHDVLSPGAGLQGSVDADPLFTNLAFPTPDLTLQAGSPAHEIAYNENANITEDYAQTARPIDFYLDAGAYESAFSGGRDWAIVRLIDGQLVTSTVRITDGIAMTQRLETMLGYDDIVSALPTTP